MRHLELQFAVHSLHPLHLQLRPLIKEGAQPIQNDDVRDLTKPVRPLSCLSGLTEATKAVC